MTAQQYNETESSEGPIGDNAPRDQQFVDDETSGFDERQPPRLIGAAWALIVGGALGLVASVLLISEKIGVLTDPTYVPKCSINPVLSCGSVINTWQASLIGNLPNPVIGAVAFPLVIGAGVAILAGFWPPTWFAMTLTLGAITGAGLIHWLIYQSLYEIRALCPYCMIAWVGTMVILGACLVLLSRLQLLPPAAGKWVPSAIVVWHGIIVLLIFFKFRDYWSTLV